MRTDRHNKISDPTHLVGSLIFYSYADVNFIVFGSLLADVMFLKFRKGIQLMIL